MDRGFFYRLCPYGIYGEIMSVLSRWTRIFRNAGLRGCLKYYLAEKDGIVHIPFGDRKIFLRKGTTDLRVAAGSLSGEFKVLESCLPREYSGIIVDAGGYIGTSAIAMRDIFPRAGIIVIEPSPDNIAILRKNTASLDNVKVVHGALVGRKRKSVLLKDRHTGKYGYTVVGSPRDSRDAGSLHEVPAYTIDQLGVDVSRIGILKLDIEGGEYELLENSADLLCRIEVVYAELHDRIVEGCSTLFREFSRNRVLICTKGEKYLSVRHKR